MRISWDQIGERFFKTGTDRAVLYPYESGMYQDGVPWNGIKAVNNNISGHEATPLYSGGVRKNVLFSKEEYGGSIECYTYPDEFEKCLGGSTAIPGICFYDQEAIPFGLSYRTYRGNDTDGYTYGYDIHLIYQSFVTTRKGDSKSLDGSVSPEEISFDFTSVPEEVDDLNPVSHLVIRSTSISSETLQIIENMLYGSEDSNPYLPLPNDLIELLTEV